jgi:hypothetical protein
MTPCGHRPGRAESLHIRYREQHVLQSTRLHVLHADISATWRSVQDKNLCNQLEAARLLSATSAEQMEASQTAKEEGDPPRTRWLQLSPLPRCAISALRGLGLPEQAEEGRSDPFFRKVLSNSSHKIETDFQQPNPASSRSPSAQSGASCKPTTGL